MSVAGSVALAVAERVERSGGARAGLVAYRALATNSSDVEARAKAILAALRCAMALGDRAGVPELIGLWSTVDRGAWAPAIARTCKELVRARFGADAIALAKAEVVRSRTPLALYCHARCLDVLGLDEDGSRIAAFREAIQSAEREGAKEIARAARLRLATLLAGSFITLREAIAEARRIDPATAEPAVRLVLAPILLRSPSRFVRAGAIGLLDGVAKGADRRLAQRALGIAARWVDEREELPTPLELDRLHALFTPSGEVAGAAPKARLVEARDVLRRLEGGLVHELDDDPLAARARDILRGRFEAHRDDRPIDDLHARLLDVVAALRDGEAARAEAVLRTIAAAVRAGRPTSRAMLAVVELALASEHAELRRLAAELARVHLDRAALASPPGGYLALAEALRDVPEAATLARWAALAAGEPGAAAALASALTRQGWELFERGDRDRAIAKLREAKALFASTS